jgi:hemerythrin-like metal-binding protein
LKERLNVYYNAINSKGSSMPDLLLLPTIGITEIDKQHKQLIECLEHLELWVGKGYGLAAACAAILSLQEYIASHFHYEEDFLRSHSYPKLEEHIQEHRKIRAQVAIYTQQITDGGDVSSELCLLLREWIMTHIGIDDIEYAKFFKTCV